MAIKDRAILTKVIASVLAGVIISGFGYFLGWAKVATWIGLVWQWVCGSVSWLWHTVQGALGFRVPLWVLLLVCFGWVLFRRWQRSRPKAQPKPESKPYFFHDLNWRETSVGWLPFCPQCDLQVHPAALGPGSMFRQGPVFFRCEHCQRDVTMYSGPYEHLVDQLDREIQRESRVVAQRP